MSEGATGTLASVRDSREDTKALMDVLISTFRKPFQPGGKLGPVIKCACCRKLFFANAIQKLTENKIKTLINIVETLDAEGKMEQSETEDILAFADEVLESFENEETIHICHTCWRRLRRAKIPSTPHDAYWNGLQLDEIPAELQLNELSVQLIAQRIPFMKLLTLPAGGQLGVKGGVINVPADYKGTVQKLLPHNIGEGQIIAVKLKKKLQFQGYDKYQYIVIVDVQKGFEWLQQNNPHYSDAQFNKNWVKESMEVDPDTAQAILVQNQVETAEEVAETEEVAIEEGTAEDSDDSDRPPEGNPIADSVFSKVKALQFHTIKVSLGICNSHV